ncbi:MAG: hypothetical protein MJ137_05625 [Clostridia bacterium]|nr:hypothetical protein [Clostridia bacterium]
MRKYCCWVSSILIACMLISCSNSSEYLVTYPQEYTPAYCVENYIRADPNLIHLIAAENEIGRIEIPGGWGYYHAIKDVPMDEYLLLNKMVILSTNYYDIVKNKNNNALPELEILSFKIKTVEIIKKTYKSRGVDTLKYGSDCDIEVVSSFDGEKADQFQSNLIECLEKGNYQDWNTNNGLDWERVFGLCIRVTFDKYEYLVWDCHIFKNAGNNNFYILFHIPTDKSWHDICIPLNQDIVELVSHF